MSLLITPAPLGSFAPSEAAAANVKQPGAVANNAIGYSRPRNGIWEIWGHSWGHGVGMSQEGAMAAARGLDGKGKRSYKEILQKYYPKTKLKRASFKTLRVMLHRIWLNGSNATTRPLTVAHEKNLYLYNASTKKKLKLKGSVDSWKIQPVSNSSQKLVLFRKNKGKNTWNAADPKTGHSLKDSKTKKTLKKHPNKSKYQMKTASGFRRSAKKGGLQVLYLDGSWSRQPYRVEYRRELPNASAKMVPVSYVKIHDYLESVVGQEIGPSAPKAAQQAQAVAALTYAARKYNLAKAKKQQWHIRDTTYDQDFPGLARGTSRNASGTNLIYASTVKAVKPLKNKDNKYLILTYGGKPINAMYGDTTGGYTVQGDDNGVDMPYLPAQKDTWDKYTYGNPRLTTYKWRSTLKATDLERQFSQPSGSLQRIQLVNFDGNGPRGGRAYSVLLDFCTASSCTQKSTTPHALWQANKWPAVKNGFKSAYWKPIGILPLIAGTSQSAAVKKVQQKLKITADGDFGLNTHNAVVAFQKKNGIKATGEVNSATWKKLGLGAAPDNGMKTVKGKVVTPTIKLQNGSTGVNVKKVQQKLRITADGAYGPNTTAAVKAFQKKQGLKQTGIVDKKTWEALNIGPFIV